MLAFNDYYHDPSSGRDEPNRKLMDDLNNENTLIKCEYAYKSTVHDLALIFGKSALLEQLLKDRGYNNTAVRKICDKLFGQDCLLEQMVKDRSYNSAAVQKIGDRIISTKLRDAIKVTFYQTTNGQAQSAMIWALHEYLGYCEYYVNRKHIKVDRAALFSMLDDAPLDRLSNLKASIIDYRTIVETYKKEHFKQIYLVNYLVTVAPVLEDINNLFGENSLIASLTTALQELAPFAKNSLAIKESEALKNARLNIAKQMGKIYTAELRLALFGLCQTIGDIQQFNNDVSSPEKIAKDIATMVKAVRDWHKEAGDIGKKNQIEVITSLNHMQELGVVMTTAPAWLQDAFSPIAGEHPTIMKLKPNTDALEKAAKDLKPSMFSSVKFSFGRKEQQKDHEVESHTSSHSASSSTNTKADVQENSPSYNSSPDVVEDAAAAVLSPPPKPPKKPLKKSDDQQPPADVQPVVNAGPPPKPKKPEKVVVSELSDVTTADVVQEENIKPVKPPKPEKNKTAPVVETAKVVKPMRPPVFDSLDDDDDEDEDNDNNNNNNNTLLSYQSQREQSPSFFAVNNNVQEEQEETQDFDHQQNENNDGQDIDQNNNNRSSSRLSNK